MRPETPTALDREALSFVRVPLLSVRPGDDFGAWFATASALAANDNAPPASRLAALKRLRRGA